MLLKNNSIHNLLAEIEYVLLNNFVSYVPLWTLRRFFYKLCGMKIGKHSRILMKTTIVCPHKICIGERSMVNENCYLDGRGSIIIGDDVTLATYTKLITGSHNIDNDNFSYISCPIVIKNNVAVFSDSLVLGGAILEEGSVFSAKSFIRKGLYSPWGIYCGNPASFIRFRKFNIKYHQEVSHLLFR